MIDEQEAADLEGTEAEVHAEAEAERYLREGFCAEQVEVEAEHYSGPTQKERIRTYLEAGGSLNPLEAWTILGIYRLAPRIHEIRNDLKGTKFKIETRDIMVENKFGEKVGPVAEYRLLKVGEFF